MARKDITMSPEEQQEFLAAGHTLIVTTIGSDGFPHVAPMWYFVEDGKVGFRSFTKSQKIVNLTRNPKITVLLETGEAYAELRGLMIKGTARLVTDPDAVLAMYGELSKRYAFVGTDPNGTWSLYVLDDFTGLSGTIAGGWSLSLTLGLPVCCTSGGGT